MLNAPRRMSSASKENEEDVNELGGLEKEEKHPHPQESP